MPYFFALVVLWVSSPRPLSQGQRGEMRHMVPCSWGRRAVSPQTAKHQNQTTQGLNSNPEARGRASKTNKWGKNILISPTPSQTGK